MHTRGIAPECGSVEQVHARQETAETYVHLVHGHVRGVCTLHRPTLVGNQRLQIISLQSGCSGSQVSAAESLLVGFQHLVQQQHT